MYSDNNKNRIKCRSSPTGPQKREIEVAKLGQTILLPFHVHSGKLICSGNFGHSTSDGAPSLAWQIKPSAESKSIPTITEYFTATDRYIRISRTPSWSVYFASRLTGWEKDSHNRNGAKSLWIPQGRVGVFNAHFLMRWFFRRVSGSLASHTEWRSWVRYPGCVGCRQPCC